MSLGKFLFFIGLSLTVTLPQVVFAEEFLEEVYDEGAPPPAKEAPAKREGRKKTPPSEPRESRWTYGLGLGGGANGFSGSFRAQYHINRFVVPEIDLSYLSFRTDDFSHKEGAIETPLKLVASNPTPFWPFVGAGPGYIQWQQSDSVGIYDDKGSLTGFYLYGILLKFSENFALVIENKKTQYLGATPAKKIVDRGLPTQEIIYEKKAVSAFSFSFQLSF